MDVTQLKDKAKARVNETRLDRASTDNERLSVENDVLRRELDRANDDRGRFLEALESLQRPTTTTTGRKHRLRRATTLAIAAGSAYVIGAKAGRERYEQIRSWWDRTKGRGAEVMPEQITDLTDTATSTIADAKQKASSTVDDIKQTAASKTQDAKKNSTPLTGS
ncbi:MAG: hypothetical protein WEA10_00105 [Actinomycetota bacterium]